MDSYSSRHLLAVEEFQLLGGGGEKFCCVVTLGF